jgi:hypothetical protein
MLRLTFRLPDLLQDDDYCTTVVSPRTMAARVMGYPRVSGHQPALWARRELWIGCIRVDQPATGACRGQVAAAAEERVSVVVMGQ